MMRFDNPEAGPSSVPFTLGPPISPTFNAAGKRLTSVEEDSHEDWEGSDVEAEVDDQRDQELLEQFPTTPKSRVNRSTSPRPPMRPPRSPRRSLESLLIHSSMGEDAPLSSCSTAGPVQQEWLKQDPRPRYRRAHSSSKSLGGRSSWSSSHQSEIPPPSPSEQYRSRVSLDATPIIPSADTDFASIIEESPHRSMETSVSITDEHTKSRPQRLPSTKRTRFLEAPDMSRSEQGASSDTNLSRRSYMSAFAGEDNGEWYPEEHRTPVDETLRSAPGVIGLGEGWAGGPQPRSKKNWFKRRPTPTTSDEDPLSLWTQSNEHATHEASASQLRNMWNRSKRNFIGASSPALHDQQDRAGMLSEGEERPASRLRGLFSLSRSNIVSPTPDSGALPRPQSSPIKTRSKRFSLGIFSSSEVALLGPQQARHIIPPSPSMSVLPLAEEIKPHRQRQYSNAALARSEGDLSSLSESIPRRTSSLKRRQGPQPPWRPNSLLVTGRPQTPFIAEVDEAIRTSGSSTSVDTPQSHETSGTSSSKRRGHALTRTATFGLDDIASEQMIDQEHNLDQQQRDHSPVSPRMTSWVHLPSKSVSFGHQVEDQSDVNHAPTMPNRRPSLGKRSASLFKRMRNVLPSALRQRSESGSIVKARSLSRSQSMKTPDSSQSQSGNTTPSLIASTGTSSSGEVRMEPLKSSSDSSNKTTTRHRRQSSWMMRSSSSLAKRLSRLTEQEEVEPEQPEGWNRNAAAGQDHDAQEVKNSRHQRRKSTNFAILTSFGAKRENKPHPLENIQRFPGSASMPALHRFASSELNLEIDLGDNELGLDDILEQGRRASILHDLGHANKPVPRTREEALQATAAALSGRIAQPGSPKRSNHMRNSSAPHASPSPSHKARSRARHNSLTLDSRSSAFISDMDMESNDRPRRNTSSVASSPCSTLTTPRHPHEHAPFMNSLTFVEGSGGSTSLIIPRSPQLRKTSRSGSDERPVFNPPWGASAASISRIGSNSGLQVPKRSSTATRMSMDSYLSQPSLYDTDEVVESHAIKVTSLEDMQRKASVISLDALGERGLWNGG
ncbi:hypothetical protein I317_04791 [Kwoniella heveanensis CBS 569]|nr:hypothetical protein I317_04791 [Kwoniella heveanensis CBS 569]